MRKTSRVDKHHALRSEVTGGTRSNSASSRTSWRVDSVREGECWIVTDSDTTEACIEVGGGCSLSGRDKPFKIWNRPYRPFPQGS